MEHYDVIIVGGGLAGLTAAIHLGRQGHRILVLEKRHYPQHKVCGEYVSNEVVPYLRLLGVSLSDMGAVAIDTLQLSTSSGRHMQLKLPLGGQGISRYAFDDRLYRHAVQLGVDFEFQNVCAIHYRSGAFEVGTDTGNTYTSSLAIGAYGKRDTLDKYLERRFIQRKSRWMAVKGHYTYDGFPENMVALHNFPGGYGGLSKTETGEVNFCYLVSYDSFRQAKNIESFNAEVVSRNPFLATFLKDAKPVFKDPLTIAQISFDAKRPVEGHMLMCGDTAGLIHPLCGNGMAMAIHSAKIASEQISAYLGEKNPKIETLEKAYTRVWNTTFTKRLRLGRMLQYALLHPRVSNAGMALLTGQPRLMRQMIKRTHGEPLCE
ncbi:NAD(P)/FAD-dependent oxidoreductase [Pareuzebyella sediminis]|uniref:NAD(P)/FAD-dependent oxidoreductase n=1 Tax=Pareuzebyella sediminis TaxID=2607998 RepID=UPI0011EE5015|nr:NAD(P)/FAD-dependent oxidoreductase [Pareuzebyella sediminis]